MRLRLRPWRSPVFRYIWALAEGMCCVLLPGLGLALMMRSSGIFPAVVMRVIARILWNVGAFAAGRRAGLHGRHGGILTGGLCAALMSLVLLSGACLLHEEITRGMLLRCCVMLFTGAAGGVVGVNTRIRRPPD